MYQSEVLKIISLHVAGPEQRQGMNFYNFYSKLPLIRPFDIKTNSLLRPPIFVPNIYILCNSVSLLRPTRY